MITTKPQRDPSTIQLGGKNVVDKSPKRARETEISINFRIANARKRGMQIQYNCHTITLTSWRFLAAPAP